MSSTLLEEAKLELYAVSCRMTFSIVHTIDLYSQGGNMSKALEHILQSMFLNIQHDQRGLMPAAALFESASLERLGM